MRQLTLLLSLLLVTSCSSSTDPNQGEDPKESPYPIRYGTWEVTSPTTGHWNGKPAGQQKLVQATNEYVIEDTLDYSMTMTSDRVNSTTIVVEVRMQFNSEDVPQSFFDYFEIERPPRGFEYTNADSFGSIDQPGLFYLLARECVLYNDYENIDTLNVSVEPPDADSTYWQFVVPGFADAVDHLSCPDN